MLCREKEKKRGERGGGKEVREQNRRGKKGTAIRGLKAWREAEDSQHPASSPAPTGLHTQASLHPPGGTVTCGGQHRARAREA